MSDLREKYEAVIGLEVHAQLLTKSKMFCACANQYGAEINTNICPVCTGQPGALPTVNQRAVELGIRAAIALDCQIRSESIFARKIISIPICQRVIKLVSTKNPIASTERSLFA